MTRMMSGTGLTAAVSMVAVSVLGACSSDEGSAEELCAALRDNPSIATTFEGFDPTDVDGALEQLRSARVTLGELNDAAPAGVRDDLRVEIDYVQALVDGLQGVEPGDAAAAVAVVQQVTDDHPDVPGAASALDEFSATSCA
jgi:hypothetical protein